MPRRSVLDSGSASKRLCRLPNLRTAASHALLCMQLTCCTVQVRTNIAQAEVQDMTTYPRVSDPRSMLAGSRQAGSGSCPKDRNFARPEERLLPGSKDLCLPEDSRMTPRDSGSLQINRGSRCRPGSLLCLQGPRHYSHGAQHRTWSRLGPIGIVLRLNSGLDLSHNLPARG